MRKRYQQAAMRLSRAQEHLRPPYRGGEAVEIKDAFLECEMAFRDLRRHGLAPEEGLARGQAVRLARFLDRSGVEDPARRGVYLIKAEQLTPEQTHEVREAVDTLAQWADERFRGRDS